ncbi:LysR family transcriptional regulator [Alginatibacterium sediminis]|uniref:LysR family transcriptional regulator n=1 Tax=Alginatibacterium sediminis TaxID=2164068 RepID=A0A420EH42_9ALTE|nr:LysR family transcriptional regulator [Alginatibacterium sediminis]RKF19984.1 LysR family transcriptional regulator [Alginatibacterium sediminis]
MELEEIYRQDLSLLIALQILIEESSVSKAAKRLHLSQSATSRILSRLREMLDDPLFSRVGQQLVPTEFALECYQQLRQPTGQIIDLLTPKEFVPAHCKQRFSIAVTDYAMQALVPYILPHIYQQAPNIRLEIVPVQHNELQEQLSVKGADIAVCRAIGVTDNLLHSFLGKVGVGCLVSPNHPLADKPISLDDYLVYPHATIAISDGVKALLDDAISQYPARTELLRTPLLESAIALQSINPLIITLPEGMAEIAAKRHGLLCKPLPFALPSLDYNMFWHTRTEHDKSHRWLRNLVSKTTQALLL